MALESSAEAPVPVRTVMRLVGDWIGRLGRVWVEGQIAELNRRGSTVFLTLRDPLAAVSVRVICTRLVFDATEPAPAEGARVVVWAKPEFNTAKGSFALVATEIRAVGIGELLARLERLRKELAAEGLFSSARKRPLPFLPSVVGLICGRDSAAERDVLRNAARRWPAVRFRVEQVAVQGPNAAPE
jgi:exodeoxyribonuclease VII large subunit